MTDSPQTRGETPTPEREVPLRPNDDVSPPVAEATREAVKRTGLAGLFSRVSTKGLMARIEASKLWVSSTRLMRALDRVNNTRANILAGGVAYVAMIAMFSMLTVGVTLIMFVLGANPGFRDAVLESVSAVVPGIIDTGNGEGIIPIDSLILPSLFTTTTIVASAIALWSSMNAMRSLRLSMQLVAGVGTGLGNGLVVRLRDLFALLVLGSSLLVTTAATMATQTFGEAFFTWLNINSEAAVNLLRFGVVLVSALVDFAVFVLIIRFQAGIRAPRRDLVLGAGLMVVGSTMIRFAGSAVVRVPDNALGQSAVALVTLLVMVNLMVRLILTSVALMVNPPAPVKPEANEEVHFYARPNYVSVSEPTTLDWSYDPSTGAIIPDASLNPKAKEQRKPRYGGVVGWWMKHRIRRLRRRLTAAENAYWSQPDSEYS